MYMSLLQYKLCRALLLVFCEIRVAQYLVFCTALCRSWHYTHLNINIFVRGRAIAVINIFVRGSAIAVTTNTCKRKYHRNRNINLKEVSLITY
jgi:hypothetical protein